MKRNQILINAQKQYHEICETSWKRYENNEITYVQHEETVNTAWIAYHKTLNERK